MKLKIKFFLLIIILMFNISSCGVVGGVGDTVSAIENLTEDRPKLAGVPGVYTDSTTETFLRKAFYEVKGCAGFYREDPGEFEDVSVIFMPPTFPCRHYESGCSGEYVNPNFLKIGSIYVWKHEVLHFLLDVNTGDPDPEHNNALFKNCA